MDAENHLLILITSTTLVFQALMVFAAAVVSVNSTLSTDGNNTSWPSPSGEYAFGFRQLNGTSTSTFSVAIWYNKIPDKTVVWHAKTNEELAEAPAGSQVELKNEGLVLKSPQGDSIWTAKPVDNSGIVSYGSMLDSGNFVLINEESNNVWESFQNPTDTLLPNQSLQYPKKVTSRFSETNFTRGKFQLYFQDGDILFSALAWPSIYQYRRYYDILASGNGSRLVFNNTSGDIYVVTTNGTTQVQPEGESWQKPQVTLDDPKEYYYRATLDYFGVFTQYAHPKNTTTTEQGWKIARYIPDNICYEIDIVYNAGVCGYNSYCSLQGHKPTCTCPNGYSLVDLSNHFGGCQPNFTLVCVPGVEEQVVYDMIQTTDGYFSGVDYEYLQPYSKQDCQQSCLHDCLCAAAAHDGFETCTKKGLPLINGQVLDGQLIFMKRGTRRVLSSSPLMKEDHAKSILLISIISPILFFTIVIATFVLYICSRSKRSTIKSVSLFSFTYKEMKTATNKFTQKLGEGTYGCVYKGTLEDEVAIKVLKESAKQDENDFMTELHVIAKTCHKNLVRLIGFCIERTHRMLVYELMSNGTLAKVIFGDMKPSWKERVEFALGIARGLVYLHEDCDAPIIHCDINPQNILIDERFTAKISDFGLAKLLSRDQIRTKTLRRGTPGYMAPEWNHDVRVTNKVDVYSFGVVLLEIICCKKISRFEDGTMLEDMERIIYQQVENEETLADSEKLVLKMWVKVAFKCTKTQPNERPTMKMVLQMLEDVSAGIDQPSPLILALS